MIFMIKFNELLTIVKGTILQQILSVIGQRTVSHFSQAPKEYDGFISSHRSPLLVALLLVCPDIIVIGGLAGLGVPCI